MKLSPPVLVSLKMRLFAWFSIVIQIAFPLSVAFTPVVASAGNDGRFLKRHEQTDWQTRVYTLKEGESSTSVAKQYNMSLDSLHKLNQFRTFAHGFDHLQSGDELDVPLAPLPEIHWGDAPTTSVSSQSKEDVQAQKVAGYASQASRFLASGANGDAAASMARGLATGAASGEIQQWLSRLGTARVQLDANKNFSLKNSKFDLLVPFFEQKDSLAFTQGSIHRTDDRTQSNLGVGYRWFASDWMLGANTFLDYDLSRDHARLGLGGEYWRDFLKLGVNTYYRLTSWKSSPDLEDYEERPANGWDVRVQYWLPSMPQLGGKLMYEQYYGDEVALFSRDHRQRNPHAITAGVNYTPVPLLTFSAEQRQGQSGKSDTRFGVEVNYQLGMPWQHQINPDAVAAMRSLIGSRYDLVERNNNIVLEYRKKEVIRLNTVDLITGYAGELKSLGVSVNSKYGLERIDWSASPLIAAGGKIEQNGDGWTVMIPAYHPGAEAVNSYTISGVAVDKKGNVSGRADTQVTVQAPLVSALQSTFTPASTTLAANGKDSQVLTLSVKDTNGQPVTIPVSDVAITAKNAADANVSSLVSKGDGVMEVTVTAGVQPTTLTLTPVVQGISLPVAQVVVSNNAPDAGRSSFSALPDTIPADNVATAVLAVMLVNKDGLPATGMKDSLSLMLKQDNGSARDSAPVTLSNITEEQAGHYTATLKGSRAGVYTIVPQYNNAPLGSLSATVTLTADSAVQVNSTITTDATTYTAGTDITVKVTLKDTNNNAVTGEKAALSSSSVTVPNATLKSSGWTDNGDGSYTAVYTAATVSTNNVATLQLEGWHAGSSSGTYAITADSAVQVNSTITTDATTYTAGTDITVKVTLKDTNNNAVTGEKAALSSSSVTVPNAMLKSSGWTDNGDGSYTAVYTAATVSTNNVATLQLEGWHAGSSSGTYAITSDSAVQVNSTITTDATTYTAGADITVKATLKDTNNNAVTGENAALSSTSVTVPNATPKSSGWTDNGDGSYTAVYTAITASTNNTATLQLEGWSAGSSSGTYAITPDSAVQVNSTITTDATTYTAGTDITVKVMLKDTNNNAVTGENAALSSSSVTVPNATPKSSGWTDNGDGSYTAVYTAITASTNNTATLQLEGWSAGSSSGTYAITPGVPVAANSSVVTGGTSYPMNSNVAVLIALYDAYMNRVTDPGYLDDIANHINVQNISTKPGSNWYLTGANNYRRDYQSSSVGTNLYVTLKLSIWSEEIKSNVYSIY